MLEALIIYSRYPEPGKTKTRMIPALGAEGAAQLQKEMSEHTVNLARQLQTERNIAIEVHFAGGNKSLMSDWLGEDLTYIPQVDGDLGNKMLTSFQKAFDRQYQRAVIIGIDCPDLSLNILNNAFDALVKKTLTIGVAEDGGYYLIGLNSIFPQLFGNIDWGTDKVLQQTKTIARKLNLDVEYLAVLSDVDRPKDLDIWLKYQKSGVNKGRSPNS